MKNRQNNKKTKQLSVHKQNRGEVFISLIHDYSANTHSPVCEQAAYQTVFLYVASLRAAG